MSELDVPFTRLANEIVEALARTNLSPYESRLLWVVFRQTYGHQKKEDWISLSQIVEMTGMRKSHVSRAKTKLIARNIVTQTGNKLSFNKYYTQWRELPKQVTVTQTGNSDQKVTSSGNGGVPKQVTPVTQTGNKSYLNRGTQKKEEEILPKKEPEKKMSDDELERRCKKLVVEQQWCDEAYASKTWVQGLSLYGKDREDFLRKARVMLAWSYAELTLGKAKLMHHEISGFVNDKGAMASKLTHAEQQQREEFSSEVISDPSNLLW